VPYCLQNVENVTFDEVSVNGKMLETKPVPSEIIKLKVL